MANVELEKSILAAAREWLTRTLSPGLDTLVEGGGSSDHSFHDPFKRDTSKLEEYENVYRRGGPVAALIDTRALMTFGTGSEFVVNEDHEPTALVDGELVTVTEWLEDHFNDRDNLLVSMGRDAYIYGDTLGEIVANRRGNFDRIELVNPKTMHPAYDRHGTIHRWDQKVRIEGKDEKVPFSAKDIGHIKLRSLGRRPMGLSLIEQNWDEVQRFASNQEAIQNALRLHGFPKYHVKVGKEDSGQVIGDSELKQVRQRFKNFNEKTNWTTGTDISIETLDTGKTEIEGVTEHDLMVLAAGFLVPEEMAGLGRGSTEATAKVRLQSFERMARSEQRTMADGFIEQYVRPVLRRYSPFPHDLDLDLRFEDVVSDQTATAEWLGGLREYYTVNEVREKMGDAPLEGEELEEVKARVEGGGASPFGDLFGGGESIDADNQTPDASASPQEGIPTPSLSRENADGAFVVTGEDGNEYIVAPRHLVERVEADGGG